MWQTDCRLLQMQQCCMLCVYSSKSYFGLHWGRPLCHQQSGVAASGRQQTASVPMQCQPGPPELMKVICCNCKSVQPCSSQLCSCRKNGLKCISACGHCHGVDCHNAEAVVPIHEDSDVGAQVRFMHFSYSP